jgi:molybdopterin biosynthesis enzyme
VRAHHDRRAAAGRRGHRRDPGALPVAGDVVEVSDTASGANVRGADDDYAAGTRSGPGTRLGAAQLGVASAFGLAQIEVAGARASPRS